MKGKNKNKEKLYSEDFPLAEGRIDLLFFPLLLLKPVHKSIHTNDMSGLQKYQVEKATKKRECTV